jgi:hypothetical protein
VPQFRASVVTAAGLAAALGITAVAHGQAALPGPWGAPVTVTPSGVPSDDPWIAASPSSAITYVWEGWDGRTWQIRSRMRGPNGGLTPAVNLSARGVSHEDPRIAIGADGRTAIAWKNMRNWNRTLQVRIKGSGSRGFGQVRTLSNPNGDATENRIAIAPNGAVVVVWAQGQAGNRRIQTRILAKGASRFGAAVNLSAGGTDAIDPSIAISADNTITVVWERPTRDGRSFIIQSRTRSSAGVWGPVQALSLPGAQSNDAVVIASPAGEVTAVWERAVDGTDNVNMPTPGLIQSRTRAAGSTTWGPIVNLSRRGTHASDPALAVAPDGTVTAVWEWASDSLAQRKMVQSRTRLAGANWGPLQVLSARGADVDDPEVVTATDGTSTVTFKRSYRATVRVQARTRPAGSTAWAGARWISGTGGEADQPNTTVAPNGAVTVVWKTASAMRVVHGQDFFLQTATTRAPAPAPAP